ncbi:Neuronal PAS domain-containing protein 4 [Armadillidium vulgare]|nr:Neuronal PAS domain-containing protein 4 [Armadillidium vulgare]
MRRDLLNAEISQLRDLLPLPPSTRQRLSQLQLMALVCVYVRKSNYFQQGSLAMKNQTSVGGNESPNLEFLKALSGFLMMLTQGGKLLYISDNAAEIPWTLYGSRSSSVGTRTRVATVYPDGGGKAFPLQDECLEECSSSDEIRGPKGGIGSRSLLVLPSFVFEERARLPCPLHARCNARDEGMCRPRSHQCIHFRSHARYEPDPSTSYMTPPTIAATTHYPQSYTSHPGPTTTYPVVPGASYLQHYTHPYSFRLHHGFDYSRDGSWGYYDTQAYRRR